MMGAPEAREDSRVAKLIWPARADAKYKTDTKRNKKNKNHALSCTIKPCLRTNHAITRLLYRYEPRYYTNSV